MEKYTKRRSRRHVNLRSIHNLCPNCLSKLERSSTGEVKCTGNSLDFWREEAKKYKLMTPQQQQEYLESLSDESNFLSIVNTVTGEVYCGFSSKIEPTMPDPGIRIADPMAVSKLERSLKRRLTEEELEEGYEFSIDNILYRLPFIRFPEDV